MRVRFVFKLINKGAVLPFHHQNLIRSFLETLIGKSQHLDQQPFNFSGLKGQTKVGKQGLHYFSKRVTIVMSSSFNNFIKELIELVFEQEQFSLGNLLLVPEFVEEEILPEPETDCKYLCISPIVISHSDNTFLNKQFVLPTGDEFSDLLYESTMNRMEMSGQYTNEEIATFSKFQVVPDQNYTQRMSARGKKFARIYTISYQNQPLEIRGYTFPLTLYAPKAVQEFVIKNGLGELTQHGFGMLDFVDQEAIKREVISSAMVES